MKTILTLCALLLLVACKSQPVMTLCPVDGGFMGLAEFVWERGHTTGRIYRCQNCGCYWVINNAGTIASTNYYPHL